MKKEPLAVLAECVDSRSGKRFLPGQIFDPAPTVAQAARLVAAGCLSQDAVAAAETAEAEADKKMARDAAKMQRDQIGQDGLFDLDDEQLAGIVASEEIDVAAGADKVTIIGAIRAKRGVAAFGHRRRRSAGR